MTRIFRALAGVLLLVAFDVPAIAQGTTTINALPNAVLPFTCSEIVPIWQGSKTVKANTCRLAADFIAATAPSSPFLYQKWLDNSANPLVLKQWDGTQWVALGSLDTTAHTWTPAGGGGGGGGAVASVFGRIGTVAAQSGDYSVGQVTGAAPLASPTFTGTVTVPTGAVLNTPASANLANATGLPPSTGLSTAVPASKGGLGADNSGATGIPVFAAGTPTVTAATGTGAPVRATSPALVTPDLGTPSAAVLTNATGLPPSTGLSAAVPVTKGGTGQTSAGVAAVTAIAGASGTPSSTTYLRGDGQWAAPTGSGTVNSGTANQFAFYNATGTAVSGNSHYADDGTSLNATEHQNLTNQALVTELPNEGATGTTVNKIAVLTGAPSTVRTASTSSTSFRGIVVAGAGTTGNAKIAVEGQASCVFDGATTANDYVIPSTTTAGACHDTGSTSYPAQQAVGKILSTNGSGGTYTVLVASPSPGAAGGSLTVTDGTTSVAGATQITFNGSVVSGTSPNAMVNFPVPNSTKTSSYAVAAGDMGGLINLAGTTGTLTLSAISGTVFATGQYVCYVSRASGNWTISATPTVNGLNSTTIPPGGSGCFVSNGSTLDFQPGVQLPTSTKLGSVIAATLGIHNFATGISPSTGALTGAQPDLSDLSGLGSGVATALAIAHDTTGGICTVAGGGCSATGNNPGGTGTELQYRGGASTFAALASATDGTALELCATTTAPSLSVSIASACTGGFRNYNTSDQVTNPEYFQGFWSGNIFFMQTKLGGGGGARSLALNTAGTGTTPMFFQTGGSTRMTLTSAQLLMAVPLQVGNYAFGSLPSAATSGKGALALVTDSATCTRGTAPTSGGSTACPVYSDGSSWLSL
jgi:hypothetical protein